MRDVGKIVAWLVGGAHDALVPEALLTALGQRLGTAGIPLDRAAIFVRTLDPDIAGRRFTWHRDRAFEMADAGFDLFESERYLANPVARVRRTGQPIRRRLRSEASSAEFPVLREMLADGFTDYLATPLPFSDGEVHAASWATRAPKGFADEDIVALEAVSIPLARIAEIRGLRRITVGLLDTYVGRQTGARVLSGHIRRGDTESIHAAIWLSDLRGFTALADRLPPSELIALLNRYFDCQVPAIEARNGEVLKFMGDGLLAIFPVGKSGPEHVCAEALAAAREARANILALEREAAERSPGLPFSLALHIGQVLYGNVGGGRRLDFTVIGPAVNLVARLERVARELDRSVITSAAFARICGEALTMLGSFTLRGFTSPQPAYGLPEEGARAADNVVVQA